MFLSELFAHGFVHPSLAIFLNEHKSFRSASGRKSESQLESGLNIEHIFIVSKLLLLLLLVVVTLLLLLLLLLVMCLKFILILVWQPLLNF